MKKRLIAISLLSLWLIGIFAGSAAANITLTIGTDTTSVTLYKGGEAYTTTITGTTKSGTGNVTALNLTTAVKKGTETSTNLTASVNPTSITTVSGTAELTITPTDAVAVGDTYTVTVTGSPSGGTQTYNITIAEIPTNKAPVVDSTELSTLKSALSKMTYDEALDNPITLTVTDAYPTAIAWDVTGLDAVGLEYEAGDTEPSEDGTTFTGGQLKIWGTPRLLTSTSGQAVNIKVKNLDNEENVVGTTSLAAMTAKVGMPKKDGKALTFGFADLSTQTSHDINGAYKVGGAVDENLTPLTEAEAEAKEAEEEAAEAAASAGGYDSYRANRIGTYSTVNGGKYFLLSANAAPATFTVKNLPDGLKVSQDSQYGNLLIYGKFTKASTLKADGSNSKPMSVTVTSKLLSKSETKTFNLTVYEAPKFKSTKTALTGLTTEKAYKQKIEANGYVEKWQVFVSDTSDAETNGVDIAATTWGEIGDDDEDKATKEAKTPVELGYTFAIDADEKSGYAGLTATTGTAGTIKWNATSKQLEGTLVKVPVNGKIYVTTKIYNPANKAVADGTTEGAITPVVQKYEIAVTGIAPTVANDSALDLVPVSTEDETTGDVTYSGNTINFKVSKGTYPITLTAYVDASTAKSFGAGTSKIDIPEDTADEANFGLGFAHSPAASVVPADPDGALPANAKRDRGEVTASEVVLTSNDEYAILTIDPSSAAYNSYKGLAVTIAATNVATGTSKPVTKTFKINVNKDNTLQLLGTKPDATGNIPETLTGTEEITEDVTYNVYLKSALPVDDNDAPAFIFTVAGDNSKPFSITSPNPKKAETQNGITATVGTDANDNPTVTFSGTPKDKKDVKFTIKAENPHTKKNVSRKVTFKVNYPSGAATEKPVFGAPSATDLNDTDVDDTLTSSATIAITKGIPLLTSTEGEGADASTTTFGTGLKVYIDKSSAKTFFGATDAIDLSAGDTKSGFTAAYAEADGVGTITLTHNGTTAEYGAYKGLPITVEAYNYVTGEKTPVKKTFKFNVNLDNNKLAWYEGEADADPAVAVETDPTFKPTVGTELVEATGAVTYHLAGWSKFEITSPKKTTTTNGITATIDTTAGTVVFSGKPLKKGKTKFAFTGENKNAKQKAQLKVTFDVQEASSAGGEAELDKLSIKLAEGSTLDWTTDSCATVFTTTGVTADTKITIEVDKGTAKSIFGATDKLTIANAQTYSDSNGSLGVEETYTGYGAGIKADGTSETPTGAKGETQSLTFALNSAPLIDTVTATAYKGANVNFTFERPNSTTGKTDRLSKSFKINLNKDEEPAWNYVADAAAETLTPGTAIETGSTIKVQAQDGREISDSSKPLVAGTALSTYVDDDGKATVTPKLTYVMDLYKPVTLVQDGKSFNGLTVKMETINGAESNSGKQRVKITVDGTPTAKKDTETKIPLELVYGGNGKKAKVNLVVSAFAAPVISNAKELEKAKEVEAGKRFSLAPKITINKALTPKYYITAEDKAILDAAMLTFDGATGAITGSAPLPTVTNDAYDDTKKVTIYACVNGNYPTVTESEATTEATNPLDSAPENADASATVAIKVKPVTPKISTSKIIWWLDGTNHDNADQLINVSNITAAQLASAGNDLGGTAQIPMAKLTFEITEKKNNNGFTISQTTDTENNNALLPSGTLDASGVESSLKGKSIEITVSNYGVSAKKSVAFTVHDVAPVIGDVDAIDITADAKKAVTATADIALESGYTGKDTAIKWKVATKTAVSGVTAKIVANSKDPSTAVLTITAKKNLAEGGEAVFTITATNSNSKEVGEKDVRVNVTEAATEDSAKPEKDNALPEEAETEEVKAEETEATPDEKAEATEEKEDRLLGEGDVHIGHERTTDSMRDTERQALSKAGYAVAAILPEISVTADGQYDLVVSIDEKVAAGRELVWFAFPRDVEASEDDEIVDFYEITGKDTTVVPENHELIVSPWFEKDITYAPVIAVKAEAGDQATDEKGLKDATEAEDKEVAKVEVLESGDEEPEEESEEVKMDLAAE